jgi:hypothetical protein
MIGKTFNSILKSLFEVVNTPLTYLPIICDPKNFRYIPKQSDLIRSYHMVPQVNGELEVHDIFWQPENGMEPPVIIYAELLLSGGKRNKETAEIIYNEYNKSIL